MNKLSKKPKAMLEALNRAVVKHHEPLSIIDHNEKTIVMSSSIKDKKKIPSRSGKKLIAGHFEANVARQMRILAAQEDTTVQALLEEALNLLFVKKGKDHIKDISED